MAAWWMNMLVIAIIFSVNALMDSFFNFKISF